MYVIREKELVNLFSNKCKDVAESRKTGSKSSRSIKHRQ